MLPLKRILVALGVLQKVSFPAHPPALNQGVSWLAPAILPALVETPSNRLGRNAGLLQGASHQFSKREHFQAVCWQMKYRDLQAQKRGETGPLKYSRGSFHSGKLKTETSKVLVHSA